MGYSCKRNVYRKDFHLVGAKAIGWPKKNKQKNFVEKCFQFEPRKVFKKLGRSNLFQPIENFSAENFSANPIIFMFEKFRGPNSKNYLVCFGYTTARPSGDRLRISRFARARGIGIGGDATGLTRPRPPQMTDSSVSHGPVHG